MRGFETHEEMEANEEKKKEKGVTTNNESETESIEGDEVDVEESSDNDDGQGIPLLS